MSYENAPATAMLATSCVACGRPLVDAKSVETGMGPECRRKHGFEVSELDPAARKLANQTIHKMARILDGFDDSPMVDELAKLFELSPVLGRKVAGRVASVELEREGNHIFVKTARFDPCVVAELKRVPGRWWVGERKATRFPASSAGEVWAALRRCCAGQVGIGPKGPFAIA